MAIYINVLLYTFYLFLLSSDCIVYLPVFMFLICLIYTLYIIFGRLKYNVQRF